MITRYWPAVLAVLFGFSIDVAGRSVMSPMPTEDSLKIENNRLEWSTTPGKRYQLYSTPDLGGSWTPETRAPETAMGFGDSHDLDVSRSDKARFFKVMVDDCDAPTISDRFPESNDFAIPRFSDLVVELEDDSPIDTNSISIAVGDMAPVSLSDSRVTFKDNMLYIENGGDIAWGDYGETITVTLAVADQHGNAMDYSWIFHLEKELIAAGDIFVLGSPDAQRAGQQLNSQQRMVSKAVYPTAAVRMSSSSDTWTLAEIGPDFLTIEYTGAAPTIFEPGQFLANSAPQNEDEIFYCRVLAVQDDAANQRLNLTTESVSWVDFFQQGSLFVEEETLDGFIVNPTDPQRMWQVDAGFSIGTEFDETLNWEAANDSETLSCSADLNLKGKFIMSPKLTVAVDFDWWDIEGAMVRIGGDLETSCNPTLSVSVEGEKTFEKELYEKSKYKVFMAGVVPVWIEFKLTVNGELELSGSITAEINTGFEHKDTLAVEIRSGSYGRSSSSPLFSSETTTTPLTYSASGNVGAEVRLIGEVDAKIYSAVGLYVNLTPALGIEMTAKDYDGEWGVHGEVYAKIDLNAGISVLDLDHDDLPAIDPIELMYEAYPFAVPEPPEVTFLKQPTNLTVKAGNALVLEAQAVSSETVSYQWYMNDKPYLGKTGDQSRLRVEDPSKLYSGTYFCRATASKAGSQQSADSEAVVVNVEQSVKLEPSAAVTKYVQDGDSVTLYGSFWENSGTLSPDEVVNRSTSDRIYALWIPPANYGSVRGSVPSWSGSLGDWTYNDTVTLNNFSESDAGAYKFVVYFRDDEFAPGAEALEQFGSYSEYDGLHSIFSKTVRLVYRPPVDIQVKTQPESQTIAAGQTCSLSFVAGVNSPYKLTYQWYVIETDVDGNSVEHHLEGETGQVLRVSVSSASQAVQYYAVASVDDQGVRSDVVTVYGKAEAEFNWIQEPPSIVDYVNGDSVDLSGRADSNYPLIYTVSKLSTDSSGIVCWTDVVRGDSAVLDDLSYSDRGTYRIQVFQDIGTPLLVHSTECELRMDIETPEFSWTQPFYYNPVCLKYSRLPMPPVSAESNYPLYYKLYEENGVSWKKTGEGELVRLQVIDTKNYRLDVYQDIFGDLVFCDSQEFEVTAVDTPTFLQDPEDQTPSVATGAVFHCQTDITDGADYQWYHDGAQIAGATQTTLILTNLNYTHSGQYRVKVSASGSYGYGSAFSEQATLTVPYELEFLEHPQDQAPETAADGAQFSCKVKSNFPISGYQWLHNGLVISGATNDTLILSDLTYLDHGSYSLTVTAYANRSAISSYSHTAHLEFPFEVRITEHPEDQSPAAITETVQFHCATEANCPVTYQWFHMGVPVDGATDSDLTLTNLNEAVVGDYFAVATGGSVSITSRVATLTVPGITIVAHPQSQSPTTADGIEFSCSVVSSVPYTVQWFHNGDELAGGTESVFAVDRLDQTHNGDYYAVVSGGGLSVTSQVATLTVPVWVEFVEEPSDLTVPSFSTSAVLRCEVESTYSPTYQWMLKSKSTGTESECAGYNLAEMDAGEFLDRSDRFLFFLRVTSSGQTFDSRYIEITMPYAAVFDEIFTSASRDEGGAFWMACNYRFSHAWGASLHWYHNGLPIEGETQSSLNFDSLSESDNGQYHLRITFPDGRYEESEKETLTVVRSAPLITVQPQDQNPQTVSGAQFVCEAAAAYPITYQWFHGDVLLSGQTNSLLALSDLEYADNGGYYAVVSGSGGVTTSAVAVLTIPVEFAFALQPEDQFLSAFSTSTVLRCSVEANYPVTYQWYRVAYEDAYGLIPYANESELELNEYYLQDVDRYSFFVRVIAGNQTNDSQRVTITMPYVVNFEVQPQSQILGVGDSVTLSCSFTASHLQTWTYWYHDGQRLYSEQEPTLTLSDLTTSDAGDYEYRIEFWDGTVISSDVATLSVTSPPPEIVIIEQPQDQNPASASDGAEFSCQVTANVPVVYQWYHDGSVITGVSSSTLTLNNLSSADGGNYFSVVSGGGLSVTSQVAVLTVPATAIEIDDQWMEDQNLTSGGTLELMCFANASGNETYQWYHDGSPIADQIWPELFIDNVEESHAGLYFCRVTDGTAVADSKSVTVSVTESAITIDDSLMYDQTLNSGDVLELLCFASSAEPVSVQWYHNGNPLDGQTSDELFIMEVDTSHAGEYWLRATTESEMRDSKSITITVGF